MSKIKDNFIVVILCGGEGQRLRPLTKKIPKPLIRIKDKSIIEYIINHFQKFNINNIFIATGYRHMQLKNFIENKYKNKNIQILNTGLKSEIINRIKKITKNKDKDIILCYGDTLVDINLNKLIQFYLNNKNKFIMSSYQLKSNFGIIDVARNDEVKSFKEKPELGIWFNIGYFIFANRYLKQMNYHNKFKDFLYFLAKHKKMKTFKHKGKHITVNTISELEKAREQIIKFI
ncbi:sugar phosphate nucleotidyltransferase [Candidatus Pelagibacter sp.]|nr:sugar phosphate nucleotidyltransferase [Candidatus Pelagibacter sp.]